MTVTLVLTVGELKSVAKHAFSVATADGVSADANRLPLALSPEEN